MLTATVNGEPVEASYRLVVPADPRCPECEGDVTFKRGTGRVTPHFAHKPGASCSFGAGETPFHRKAKLLLLDWLRGKGHDAWPERRVGEHPSRRADVLDTTAGRVYEVRFSPADHFDVLARSEHYARHDLPTTWLFPWKPSEERSGLHRFTRSPVLSAFARWKRQFRDRRPLRSAFGFIEVDVEPRLLAGTLKPWELWREGRDVCPEGGDGYWGDGHWYTSARWVGFRLERAEPLTVAPEAPSNLPGSTDRTAHC